MRSLARLLGAGLSVIAAGAVLAHAHLEQATPADGSIVTSAPHDLVLQFSEAARLTALWISRDGAAKDKLPALARAAQTRIVVPLPPLVPGHYVISWRALSADGHVVPGQVRFTLGR
jgi:methionine-rich copper-binding protein CopC